MIAFDVREKGRRGPEPGLVLAARGSLEGAVDRRQPEERRVTTGLHDVAPAPALAECRGGAGREDNVVGTRGPGSKPPGTPCQLRYPAFTGMKLPFAAAIFGSITVRTPSLNAAVVFSVSTGPGSGTIRVNAPHARSAR